MNLCWIFSNLHGVKIKYISLNTNIHPTLMLACSIHYKTSCDVLCAWDHCPASNSFNPLAVDLRKCLRI